MRNEFLLCTGHPAYGTVMTAWMDEDKESQVPDLESQGVTHGQGVKPKSPWAEAGGPLRGYYLLDSRKQSCWQALADTEHRGGLALVLLVGRFQDGYEVLEGWAK